MRKKILFFLVGIIIVIAGIGFSLYVYGFKISIPRYNDAYFTRDILVKYSSPELAFNLYFNALEIGDVELYQEVLGRKLTERELGNFKPLISKNPHIVEMDKGKDYRYFVTNNDGGMFFEKVKGRWVFTPEDWGVNVRTLFR